MRRIWYLLQLSFHIYLDSFYTLGVVWCVWVDIMFLWHPFSGVVTNWKLYIWVVRKFRAIWLSRNNKRLYLQMCSISVSINKAITSFGGHASNNFLSLFLSLQLTTVHNSFTNFSLKKDCGGDNLAQKASYMKQTIVANLEAPRLCGVQNKDVVKFKKERKLYLKQITEKNQNCDVQIIPISLHATIDDSMLRTFIFAGWIATNSMDRVMEEEPVLCIEKTRFEPEEHELSQINISVSGIKMDMKIKGFENRIWNFFQRYMVKLENNGLHELPEKTLICHQTLVIRNQTKIPVPNNEIDHLLEKRWRVWLSEYSKIDAKPCEASKSVRSDGKKWI